MSLVVGLDVGTQSVKLVAYDAAARRVLATQGRPLELIAGDDGSREQRADGGSRAIRACFAQLDPALARAGQRHRRVGTAARLRAARCRRQGAGPGQAVVRHQHPGRSAGRSWTRAGGAARCIELAGNPILAGYTASKLPWTRKHRPEAYARLASILLPHDYVNFWLTGERWMEYGDASGTGWLDVRTRQWSAADAGGHGSGSRPGRAACRRWSRRMPASPSRRPSPPSWACRATCASAPAAATT